MTRNQAAIGQLKRKLKGLKDTDRHLAGVAGARLSRTVVPKMQRKIINNDAVASTELFRSFRVTGPTRQDFGRLSVRLTNYAPHAPYVEFGTGGFEGPSYPSHLTRNFAAPPLSPHLIAEIRAWIYIKPTFVIRENMTVESTAQAIAIAIAFGGDTRPAGTPAQPFFFNAWFEEELKFRKSMRRTFKRKIKREMAG